MIKVDKYVEGLKVVRGPDWGWGNQDGGKGCIGEIIERNLSTGWTTVLWSNGYKRGYRIGVEGKYDLALANEADAHLLKDKSEFHNPQKLTSEQVGEGYRLLYPSEIKSRQGIYYPIQFWRPKSKEWDNTAWGGDSENKTYRVPACFPKDFTNQYIEDYEANAHLSGKPTLTSKPTLESLKAMFPVGTEFIPVNKDDGKYSKSFKVLKSWKLFEDAIGYYFKNSRNESAHYGYLYLNSGKLAEIVSKPTEFSKVTTIADIEAKFPVGTVFKPISGKKDCPDERYEELTVKEGWKIIERYSGLFEFQDHLGGCLHNGYVYAAEVDRWAEIVTVADTSSEFKVGDKVIITQGDCLYMNQYIGQVATITKVLSNGDVNIDIDKGAWYWVYASGHFIPYKEEHVPYKVGDSLTAKDGSTFVVKDVKWDETESITGKEITNGKTWLYESESRGWFTHNFITMVWSKEQPVIEETPLEKAKRMYPPGTRFKSIMYNSGNFIVADLVYTVESDWEINEDADGDIEFLKANDVCAHSGYVYRQSPDKLEHRWAEILPIMSEESPFITEAKRRYPVGTKFRPAHMLDEEWYEDHYCIVTEDTVFELREDSKAVTACIPSRYPTWVEEDTPETPSKYGNTNLFRHVYFETCGWAPIYEEPVKYSLLKGNDIVIFDGPNGPRKYTVNWTCLSFQGRDNDIIFQDLGVDKYQLASKMYGYSIYSGNWPSFNSKDYKAATNLVNELHRLCAEAKSSVQQTTNNNLNNNSNGKFSKTNSDIIEVPRLNQQIRLHVESGSFGFEGSESKSTVTSNHRNIKAQVSRERGSFDESYVCRSVLVGRRNPSI